MKSAGQIRCSVYLHADQYPEDAALVHRIASARLGRRAQQFLALVRSGIIAEQTPILQQDTTTQVIAHQTPLGRRTVIHLKLRRDYQPQIVAEMGLAGSRSVRLRELALKGLLREWRLANPHTRLTSAEVQPAQQAIVEGSIRDVQDDVTTRQDPLASLATPSAPRPVLRMVPLDSMLAQFASMVEQGQ